MIAVQINVDGYVVNRIVVNDLSDLPNLVEAGAGAVIGAFYNSDTGVFTPPTPDAGEVAEQARLLELEEEITSDTTLSNIKSMTNAEINTWFDNNINDAASAIQLLKRIVKVLIRRVL